mgnify:CR=1 FL=1
MTQFLQKINGHFLQHFFCALINQFRIENGEREKKTTKIIQTNTKVYSDSKSIRELKWKERGRNKKKSPENNWKRQFNPKHTHTTIATVTMTMKKNEWRMFKKKWNSIWNLCSVIILDHWVHKLLEKTQCIYIWPS